jgi:NAD(P)-dependent dehydrogenase (short-subunit alcohol dehydrogenase family)
MPIQDLKDKWVLVTGAAAGIGRATALAFAEAGAKLVVTDLSPERLEPLRAALAARGSECIAEAVDVADEAAMRAFAERVHARVPALDVLVNNAGIGYIGPFLGTPLDAWQRVFGVNLMGVVHGCRHFLPRMQQAGGVRRVVNLASLAGIAPAPNMSAYAASKHAIVGLSEGLALELRLAGTQVGVTTVCPGIINTDITKAVHNVSPEIGAAQLHKLQAYYEAQGVGPEVVAAAIVDGVRRGRALVLVGPFARPIYHLRRLSRRLAQWLMLIDARKAGFS